MGTGGTLGAWQEVLIGLVLLAGLLSVVVPGIPAPLVVWAAVLWWAMSVKSTPGWWLLVGATGVLLAYQAVRLMLPVHHHRRIEVPRAAMLLAVSGGIAGFFILPVVGVLPGFLAGLYGWERVRLGHHHAAVAATRRAMRGPGWKTLTELATCLLVVGGWVAALVLA